MVVSKVQDFIARRFQSFGNQVFDCFLEGNCYWFAHILCTEFPELKMYYVANEGHFVAGANDTFFDVRGIYKQNGISDPTSLTPLDWIKENDSKWYERLMRDCRH